MRTALLLACALPMFVAVGVGAQEPVAHVRGGDGKWLEVPVESADGRTTVRLTPQLAGGATATIVLDKPEWMRLEDSLPPMIMSAAIGERVLPVEGGLDLGAWGATPPPIRLTVADDGNPVDPASIEVRGLPAAARVDVGALGPPQKTGEVTITLPELAAGVYDATLCLADLSPQANTLRVPLRLAIMGLRVAADGSGVTLVNGHSEYTMANGAHVPLTIGPGGPTAYVTGQVGGTFFFPREVGRVEVLQDTAEVKSCRVTTRIGDADGKPLEMAGRFEVDLTVRSDLPCLLARSRCFNEVADGEVYTFWGWLAGGGFETVEGPQEWLGAYQNVGKVGWVYLPPTGAGRPGIGWISPLMFQQSRFNTMLLLTDPTRIATKKGEAVSMDFAIMPAESAEQVAQVAAQLDEMGVWGKTQEP